MKFRGPIAVTMMVLIVVSSLQLAVCDYGFGNPKNDYETFQESPTDNDLEFREASKVHFKDVLCWDQSNVFLSNSTAVDPGKYIVDLYVRYHRTYSNSKVSKFFIDYHSLRV